jgi:hypothetical protein
MKKEENKLVYPETPKIDGNNWAKSQRAAHVRQISAFNHRRTVTGSAAFAYRAVAVVAEQSDLKVSRGSRIVARLRVRCAVSGSVGNGFI